MTVMSYAHHCWSLHPLPARHLTTVQSAWKALALVDYCAYEGLAQVVLLVQPFSVWNVVSECSRRGSVFITAAMQFMPGGSSSTLICSNEIFRPCWTGNRSRLIGYCIMAHKRRMHHHTHTHTHTHAGFPLNVPLSQLYSFLFFASRFLW